MPRSRMLYVLPLALGAAVWFSFSANRLVPRAPEPAPSQAPAPAPSLIGRPDGDDQKGEPANATVTNRLKLSGGLIRPHEQDVVIQADGPPVEVRVQAAGMIEVTTKTELPYDRTPTIEVRRAGTGPVLRAQFGSGEFERPIKGLADVVSLVPDRYTVTVVWNDKRHDLGEVVVEGLKVKGIEFNPP